MNDQSNACTLNIKSCDALLIIPVFVICSFGVFALVRSEDGTSVLRFGRGVLSYLVSQKYGLSPNISRCVGNK